jgi:hypothetical protein
MNSTISVKTLLTVLLAVGFVAVSVFGISYYQKATASEARAQALSADLKKTQSQLASAQSQLKQTKIQLSDAQTESQRRLSLVFAQEDNVKVLKACLTGVASDDMYYRKGTDAFVSWTESRSDDDYQTALANFKMGKEAMESVSDDCGRASSLLQ